MPDELPVNDADEFRRDFLDLPPASDLGGGFGIVWEYWNRKRGDRIAPSRADIDPADLVPCLEGLMLLDVVGSEPKRFRHRLAGTTVDQVHGISVTGVFIDEMKPRGFAVSVNADLLRLATERQPQLVRMTFTNRHGLRRQMHTIRLPLSADGESVNMVMVYASS